MPKPNLQFEIDTDELDLIEEALRVLKQSLTEDVLAGEAQQVDGKVLEIHELLGRLHNQKTFFRPSAGAYVSG